MYEEEEWREDDTKLTYEEYKEEYIAQTAQHLRKQTL